MKICQLPENVLTRAEKKKRAPSRSRLGGVALLFFKFKERFGGMRESEMNLGFSFMKHSQSESFKKVRDFMN